MPGLQITFPRFPTQTNPPGPYSPPPRPAGPGTSPRPYIPMPDDPRGGDWDPDEGETRASALDNSSRLRDLGMNAQLNQFERTGQSVGDALGFGYGLATGAAQQQFDYGQGQLGMGLQGGLAGLSQGYGQAQGALGAGYGAAMGALDPYRQQDMTARGAYANALMGDDSAFWQRQSDQRAANINTRLANQGLLGSSGGRNALVESETQLQNAREQQFYDRARGLFNDSAGQMAGLSGRFGEASAGLYGELGRGIAGAYDSYGARSADAAGRAGEYLGNLGMGYGQGLANTYGQLGLAGANAMGSAFENQARDINTMFGSAGGGGFGISTPVGGFSVSGG